MTRATVERKLAELGEQLKKLRAELLLADEQHRHLAETADDARLRALVSETPVAEREHREAQRHAEAMLRHRDQVRSDVERLEQVQDDLLDRLTAGR